MIMDKRKCNCKPKLVEYEDTYDVELDMNINNEKIGVCKGKHKEYIHDKDCPMYDDGTRDYID